jgi:hypothetical protein
LAKAWDIQISSIEQGPLRENASSFYRTLFWGNFAAARLIGYLNLRQAAGFWLAIYQELEVLSRRILEVWCGPGPELETELSNHLSGEQLQYIRHDWVRLLLEYMRARNSHLDIRSIRRAQAEIVRPFRNSMGHEGDARKRDALYFLGMPVDMRRARAQTAIEATKSVIQLVNLLSLASAKLTQRGARGPMK